MTPAFSGPVECRHKASMGERMMAFPDDKVEDSGVSKLRRSLLSLPEGLTCSQETEEPGARGVPGVGSLVPSALRAPVLLGKS